MGQRIETEWKLPVEAMTPDEIAIHQAVRKLLLDVFPKYLAVKKAEERRTVIRAKA